MAVPAGVYRVVIGGTLPNGEIWESGFWVAGAVPSSNAAANACALLWYGQLNSTDSSGAMHEYLSLCFASVFFKYVRVYCYPTGGTAATYIGEHFGPAQGADSGTPLPNQIACVVSLRTDEAGRTHRGRMYLPPMTVNHVGAGGQMASGVTAGIAAAWAECFSDWNASEDNGIISVVSQKGAGGHTPVTGCVVDSLFDTQRRRRNKAAATYLDTGIVTLP